MQVDQRNSGSAVTNTGATTFYLDKWNVLGTTSAVSFLIKEFLTLQTELVYQNLTKLWLQRQILV